MDRETVDRYRKDAEAAYRKMSESKIIFNIDEADWLEKSQRFRQADYDLALTDGRLKVLPEKGAHRQRQVKSSDLTLEQIKAVAAKLGVI